MTLRGQGGAACWLATPGCVTGRPPLVSHRKFATGYVHCLYWWFVLEWEEGAFQIKLPTGNSETAVVPCHAICTMSAAEWKKKCEEEWSLQSAPMPDGLDWKSVYEAKPFGRNLLMNPAPYGTISLLHTLRLLFCCLSLIHRKFGLQTDGMCCTHLCWCEFIPPVLAGLS